ncbi:hypothetical protein BMETH_1004_0 [methanotrophic bacterial endosymbiont of Bathymodiolus sp.]|nr:hypothetical protein BMETH_1004_0 [methanotrophic bacterial endosymbiont of Bathymodiolus sp.]
MIRFAKVVYCIDHCFDMIRVNIRQYTMPEIKHMP